MVNGHYHSFGNALRDAAFPGILKITSMFEMIIGRLEIFPVLYLIRSLRVF